MKNLIKSFLPRPIISNLQYIRYFFRDVYVAAMGQRDPMIPPTRMMFDGPRSAEAFKNNGETYLNYFISLGNLKPDEKILDVGCGIGRKTLPLTKYLNERSRYEGFDITKIHINWCKKNISTRYPNFHFQLVDIYNKHYNPKGKIRASEFRFPFDNESFDFAISGSVFTHIVPEDMENYLAEIARVLKKGGRSLITFLLLNEESRDCISKGKGVVDARFDFGLYCSDNPLTPEDAICIDEAFIRKQYSQHQLAIQEPIHYGSWCGREKFLSEQDIIIARKL